MCYINGDVVRVYAGTACFNSLAVYISAKDLDFEISLCLLHVLTDNYGYGIDLFSCRAARNPDPYWLIIGLVFKDMR